MNPNLDQFVDSGTGATTRAAAPRRGPDVPGQHANPSFRRTIDDYLRFARMPAVPLLALNRPANRGVQVVAAASEGDCFRGSPISPIEKPLERSASLGVRGANDGSASALPAMRLSAVGQAGPTAAAPARCPLCA